MVHTHQKHLQSWDEDRQRVMILRNFQESKKKISHEHFLISRFSLWKGDAPDWKVNSQNDNEVKCAFKHSLIIYEEYSKEIHV